MKRHQSGQSMLEYVILLAIVLVLTVSAAPLFKQFKDQSLTRAFCRAVHTITDQNVSRCP